MDSSDRTLLAIASALNVSSISSSEGNAIFVWSKGVTNQCSGIPYVRPLLPSCPLKRARGARRGEVGVGVMCRPRAGGGCEQDPPAPIRPG